MPLREFTGELDKPAGLHEFTGELDPAQRRELPAGVQPSTAGAGRGTQGGPTATQLEQAKPIYERAWNAMRGLGSVDTSVDTVGPPVRRGGMRSEVQPFVAPGQPFASDLVTPNPLGSPSGLPTPPVAVSSPLETVAGESIRPGSEKRIIGRLLARPGTTDATGRVLLQALKPASDSPELGQTVQPGLGPPRSVTLPEIGQDIATAAKQTPNAYKAALVQLKEGGDDPRAIDWKNQEILKAEQYAKDTAGMIGAEDKYVLGITRSTLRRLPQQSAFSVLSMGAGIAAGAGPQLVAGALSRNPIVAAAAGYGTGALGSGIAAYRMDTNQVLRQVRESLNEAAVQARGEPLTDEEFIQVADKYHALVREHGLHEALWEALGNVVEFGMTKVMFKAASAAIKGALLRNAMKFFGAGAVNLLTEVGTEAATQIGQHNVEQKLGIGPGPARSFGSLDDWITSTKEVGPDILLLMGTTGMAAAGAGRVSGMVKGARGAGQTQAEFNAEQMARERGFLTPPDQRKFFYQTFDELAAKHGITPEASKAARAEADGMPLAAVPGFLGRFAESYTTQKGRPMSAVEAANPTPAPEGNAPRGTPQNVTATSKPSEALNVAGIFPEETGLAGPSTTPSVQTTTDAAAHVAAASPLNGHPEPTPGQAEAGNYRKGHVQIAGMDISIENPQGSTRRGVDESGNAWESTMTAHYGYIRNSVGADKEHVDVFIKPGTHQDYAGPVFVVDQLDPKTGLHDEHKALIGYDSQTEAEAAYKSNYAADWQGMGPVTELPMPAFKAWAYSKEAKKPLAAVQRAVPAQAAPESQSAAGTIQGVRHGNEGQEGQRGQGGQGLLAPAAAGAPAPVAPILQNRNRSTPAAIEQMRAIARNPDYNRLGFSRDFSNGAPVVAGGGIAASQFGRSDTATTSDGRQIPVRYAVVEAKQLLASNAVGGETNQRYGNAQVVATRAIAGNGRIAGLQSAYANNRADAYKTALLADDLHGVPRAAIEAMKAPVLVRVMPESEVTANIGDVSNRSGTLTLSPVEQARTDAARVNLDALEFTDAGDVTLDAVRKFVQAMPKAEQGGLIDTDGSPTRQAVDRLNNAVFVRAYPHSEGLVRLYAQATDPEARNVMSALARAAPAMSKLDGAGALDIREIVTQAAEAAVNARRRGVKLADVAAQIDLSADPASNEVLKVFADNPRAAKPIAEALIRAAEFAHQEAIKPAVDMFGAVPRGTREQVIGQLGAGNEARSAQAVEVQARGRAAGADVARAAADARQQAAAEQTQAGRAGEQGQKRGEVGGKLASGEVVLTASGRETTPFPKVSLDTNRRAIKTLRTVDQWIMHNALAEAEARGDDFNARQFRANQDRPSQSDKDSAEEYLFGEAPTTAKEPQRSLSAAEELAQGNLFAEPAKTPSWVIQNKETGEVIAETYDPKKVAALNKEKYKATPILEYLQNLNRKIKEEAPTTAPAQGVSYPSVEDIHAAADAKHIAWDGDVTFEKMTEQVTGKKHLDSLTGAERQAVLERVQKMAERPSAQQMEQRHQLQLQKRIGVLQSLLNCLGA